MNAGDHFKIASLTKTYTATVVLQLVAEGKLRLSDSVERWVPGLVPNGGKITIRQLLNHTSGLAEFDTDPRYLKPYLSGDFGYYWAPRKLVQMAVSHTPLFPPGVTKHTSYSNTNYVLLGLVVEAATGNSIGAELRNRIFRPLHLTARATRPSPVCRARTRTATSWSASRRRLTSPVSARRSRRPPARSSPPPRTWPTSTARCSPGHLVRPDLLRAMKTTILRASRRHPGQRYGLGLELFPTSCGDALGHNGVVPGYMTFAFSSGDGSRQAVLMVNLDSGSFPKAGGSRFFQLLDKAYCSRT